MSEYPETKKAAQQIGASYFMTGRPCKRGHVSHRYTIGGGCVACAHVLKNISASENRTRASHENMRRAIEAAENGRTTFVPDKPCKHGHLLRFAVSNNCVECDRLARERNKLSKRFRRIEKIYGVSMLDYEAMRRSQGNKCFICHAEFKSIAEIHVDHCHSTGKVRKMLCVRCNIGIGMFLHEPELMRRAVLYCDEA